MGERCPVSFQGRKHWGSANPCDGPRGNPIARASGSGPCTANELVSLAGQYTNEGAGPS